ncbi:hypothetical protein ES703_44785 [subsurface metagenome]
MKKAFVSLLTVSTIVSLVLILSTCGGSGKAGGKCMIVNGKKECSMWIEFEFRFSPKPEVLDEIFVLDLSNNFLLLGPTSISKFPISNTNYNAVSQYFN